MASNRWEKLVSRAEEMLHWDACVSIRREKLRLGAVYWGTKSDLILKNDTALGTWYQSQPSDTEESTNLDSFLEDISSELDRALDDAIVVIDRDVQAMPAETREGARDLYLRFRLDMGLMVFGLNLNALPKRRLEAAIGHARVKAIEEQAFVPYRRTLLGREGQAIFDAQVATEETTDERVRREASRLADEFGFIHSEYVSDSWDVEDYLEAIRGPRLPIHSPSPLATETFTEYERWLISVIQKLSYLHDEGKAALVRTNWALRETFKGLGLDDRMLRMTESEFLAWTENGTDIDAALVAAREHYFAIVSVDDLYAHHSGQESVRKLVQAEGLEESALPDVRQFKGSIASTGKARGRVHIVVTQEDSRAFVEGDILVASMTTPAYMDAIRRAAAFVTDEGGTICHAAIVSRELKKPCIVGTKIATKILQNGDLIEVDAEKGVVRIIEPSP